MLVGLLKGYVAEPHRHNQRFEEGQFAAYQVQPLTGACP